MSTIILVVAALLILGGLLHFILKVLVAYSRCSGGAPLLDGVIFPPLFLGMGSAVFFRHYGIAASGLVVGLASLAVVITVYYIAWRLGARGH
jgi:hypothetical protein